ncbi:uncharacterized protein Bfra_006369 [Botrytis fragariae]|uniref:Uncharacterized protein n=1 Tax=Botrytis fragariae TaxID=1964551 RepID=A0A8H6EP77_9HELO|nr:uncharacterized protein Bfra_006369 [Botrytis fragariae]KAF5879165.1 hypothetical protein Bfra_006369 [Botrytis fragariae]
MAGASRFAVTDFPLFMNLAEELRSKIWRDTLPDAIKPAFFRYKRGCWHLLHLTKYDPHGQYDPVDGTKNIRLEFRHNMLGNVQIETPLASAREIAVKWAHTNGFVVQEIEGYPIFLCPFNPGRYILYIPPDGEVTFLNEPFKILREQSLSDRTPCEERMLVIIIETSSETEFADRYLNLQDRWEYGRFMLEKFRGKWELYELLDGRIEEMQKNFTCDDTLKLKIRVAAASKDLYGVTISFRHVVGVMLYQPRLLSSTTTGLGSTDFARTQDSLKRGEQVTIMSEMYKKAWKVVAWLSPDREV